MVMLDNTGGYNESAGDSWGLNVTLGNFMYPQPPSQIKKRSGHVVGIIFFFISFFLDPIFHVFSACFPF